MKLNYTAPTPDEPFHEFYQKHFYELFAGQRNWRVGLARLAFEAGRASVRDDE